jgi:EAL and modified HD-GYP domain-containing signal transduction protein
VIGKRSSSPLPAAPDALDLPPVSLRTAKVVNALGHQIAVQWLPAHSHAASAGSGAAANDVAAWIDELCTAVLAIGLRALSEQHPVFIEVGKGVLLSSLVDTLTPRWAVVQLSESLPSTQAVLQRLVELRARGLTFSLSCNRASASHLKQLEGHVDGYHVDIGCHDLGTLKALWPELRGRPVHLRGIDRLHVFREGRAQGVHAYSGPLLAAPMTWTADQLPACDAQRVEAFRDALSLGVDDADAARLIERDPALLLRVLVLACDGLLGAPTRPGSINELVARLRTPTGSAWLQVFQREARHNAALRRPDWAASARHLSTFMRRLTERLVPEREELQRQAVLLGHLAYFRHTLPSRMVSHAAMPLASPTIEDAWMHRQCLLGAVLDIGLRLMFDGAASDASGGGMTDLFEQVGQQVRDGHDMATLPTRATRN